MIARRAPQKDLDAGQERAAAHGVLVGFIHGEPSGFPARDGEPGAQQRGRVRGLRVLAQFDAQGAAVLGARRTGRRREEQCGGEQNGENRSLIRRSRNQTEKCLQRRDAEIAEESAEKTKSKLSESGWPCVSLRGPPGDGAKAAPSVEHVLRLLFSAFPSAHSASLR